MLRAPRRLGSSTLALLCLTGLAAVTGPVRAAPAEPGQIIGYANADRSGPSQIWTLPPDKPYLYVPAIAATLKGRVMAVEAGPEVAVVLFKSPHFTSRDQGCQPALGTTQQPHKAWLGATARFAPPGTGQSDAPPPEASDHGYGSLIVYRTDLGPPPGALFMARRVTLGLRCANPVHKTVYNRIFVPVAEAPDAERCFDLVGNYPGSKRPFQLDFVKSDRLVLMMPSDLSERYARIRHDYSVTLYDGLSCTGASATLDSRARAGRDVRLTQVDFRDRTRSLRISYDYGNADAFLVRQPSPPPAAPAVAQAPKPAPIPVDRTLSAQPIEDPAVGQSPPKSAPAPTPQPKLPPPPPPPPIQNTKAPAPVPKPVPSAQALIQPKAQTPAVKKPVVEAPVKSASTIPVGKPITDSLATQQPVVAAPTARSIPKLSPRLTQPSTQTAALPSLPKTFDFPVQDIFRLNHCLQWQSGCGEPAASAWCREKGYSGALEWTVDKNIGAIFPTVTLGNQEVCASDGCDGFKKITCTP